ncbi:hypothetical protein [Catenulispora rubra]|uniref:hypothetical protein n=1 Tax=Catenulispora rubra TaxID=280293 RepID=UPI0018921F58|nr:hypothetical protein [Catenulispora rubra]
MRLADESFPWVCALAGLEPGEVQYGNIPIALDTLEGHFGKGFLLYSDRAVYLSIQKVTRRVAREGMSSGTVRVPFEDITWLGPPLESDNMLEGFEIQFSRNGRSFGYELCFTPIWSDILNQLMTIQHLRNNWGGYRHPPGCLCHLGTG